MQVLLQSLESTQHPMYARALNHIKTDYCIHGIFKELIDFSLENIVIGCDVIEHLLGNERVMVTDFPPLFVRRLVDCMNQPEHRINRRIARIIHLIDLDIAYCLERFHRGLLSIDENECISSFIGLDELNADDLIIRVLSKESAIHELSYYVIELSIRKPHVDYSEIL